MNIRKDDNVLVISGKDKGKQGKVLRAFPKIGKIIVSGVNVVKKHQRPRKSNEKGQILDKTMPISVSNVMLIDKETGKRTRIKYEIVSDKKVRVSVKSGSIL